jgi:hypothetical protein
MMVDFRNWENAVAGTGQTYSFTAEKVEWYTDTEDPETVENFDYIIHTTITPLDDADIFVRRIDKFHGSPNSSKYMPDWYHAGFPGRVAVFTTFIDGVIATGQSNVDLIEDETLQEQAQDAVDIVSNARDTLIDTVVAMNDFITNMAISRNYISSNYILGDRLRGVFSNTLQTFVDDYIAAANSFLANWNLIQDALDNIQNQQPGKFTSATESVVQNAVEKLEEYAQQVLDGVDDGVLDKAETLRDMWTVNDVKNMFDSLSKVEHYWDGLEVTDDYSSLKAYPHRALPQKWVNTGTPAQTLQEWETKILHNSYATQWVTDDDPDTYQAQLWDYNPPVFGSEHVRHIKHNDVSGNGWHFYDNRGIEEFKTLTVGCDVFPKWSSSDFGVPRLYQFDSWSTHSYPTEPSGAKVKPSITIKMPTSQFKYTIDCYRSRCVSSPTHDCPDTLRRFKMINAIYEYEQTPSTWTWDFLREREGQERFNLFEPCCTIIEWKDNTQVIHSGLDGFNGTVSGVVTPLGTDPSLYDETLTLYNYATYPLDEHLLFKEMTSLWATYPRDTVSVPTTREDVDVQNYDDCPLAPSVDTTASWATEPIRARHPPGFWLVGDSDLSSAFNSLMPLQGPHQNSVYNNVVTIIQKSSSEIDVASASHPIVKCVSVFEQSYDNGLPIGYTHTRTLKGSDTETISGGSFSGCERTQTVASLQTDSQTVGELTLEWEADNAPL